MSSPFRNYDAWVTREPDYPDILVPGDEGWPRCSCGAFLAGTPDFSTTGELTAHCTGKRIGGYVNPDHYEPDLFDPQCNDTPEHDPHEYVEHSWVNNHHVCGKCYTDNVIVDA